ncbi:MAG: RDD family protein [Thermoanaerobaculales bacterium]|nr:RDD family protein [Thermoanaerobaculales bacterium]
MSDEVSPQRTNDEFRGRDLPSASALRRLTATLLDMILFCGVCSAVAIPMLRAAPLSEGGSALDVVSAAAGDASWLGHAAGVIGLLFAFWWCYFLVGWGLMGGTPGKLILGIRVVDHEGRCPIGPGRAALRLVAYTCSSITLLGGHLLAVFRGDRRTLHDVLAGTRVVRWKRPK